MPERQVYTAIDLGTTNSVIAYGNIIQDKMRPTVLELDRKSDTGSTSRNTLLPSVVYYSKNREGNMVADVGDYAKSRYGTREGYVCKSVKSLMGVTDRVPLVDEIPDKTPEDVSAQILSYMVKAAKMRLFQPELRDVVITVPASFDSDQCQATIKAAEKAGINVENMHDVLLYEPKAVIYDFMRMQEEGAISSNVLSLDTNKNVLVFDLGGGTLDVTLHRVGYSEEGIVNIKDLAISRYSLLGGDNFDDLLAADMLGRFEEYYGIRVSVKRREEVMNKCKKLAEKLKIDLSLAYESSLMMTGSELPDDYEIDVMDAHFYDAYSIDTVYTKAEIEEILEPLMGSKYTKDDVKFIHRMGEGDINNIIYPVLDVLEKAGENVKVDAVILNGGMTKFYMIRKRLTEFFGFEPLTTNDPDLAVARGAVYYHYCLHKYNVSKIGYSSIESDKNDVPVSNVKPLFNTNTILNDTINLGLRGEYVSQLIPAGTELPYHSEEIRDKFKLEKATDTIGIEMFLGRGKTKNLPNRRIATRTVKFDTEFPAGTPISFQIYIDSLRMMTMEAWITDRPRTKTIMEMDMASLKKTTKSRPGINVVDKIELNAKSEMNALKSLAERNKNLPDHPLNAQIKSAIDAISEASNPQDFFDPCMNVAEKCYQSDMMLAYIYSIAVSFKDGWNDSQKRRIVNIAKRHFNKNSLSIMQNGYILQKAVWLISVFDPDFVDFFAEYLYTIAGGNDLLKQSIFMAVIKNEADDEKVIGFFEKFFKLNDLTLNISNAFIRRYGRGCSKENLRKFSKLVKLFAGGLNEPNHDDVPRYLPLLIAEMFSNEVDNPLQEDGYIAKPVWKAVKKYLDEDSNDAFCSAVTNIWSGQELSDEEEQAIKFNSQE